jgi:hypothetical protein
MEPGPGQYMQPQYPPPYGYGQQRGWARPSYPIETKPFYLTSEFVGSILAIAGIAITSASSDAFGAWRAWILITAVTVGYLISRGIAKSGTRSNANDPREHMSMNWGRGDSHGQSQGQSQQRSSQPREQQQGDEEKSGPLFG